MKNVCIWEIDNSIEDVLILINDNYNINFKSLDNVNISEGEKVRICRWTYLGDVENIRCEEVGGKKLRYITCKADIEYPKISENVWIDKNGLLSKDIRVSCLSSFITFIQDNNRLYCVVEGSKSNEAKIRSKLMKSKREAERDIKWGKVNYKNVIGYNFKSKFYYWLVIKKGKEFKFNNDKFLIKEVKGFRSNTERRESHYKGSGVEIDNEIPLRALMSMDEQLISMHIVLYVNETHRYTFALDYDGRLSIYEEECIIIDSNTKNIDFIPLKKLILDIYFKIIPALCAQNWEDLNENWEEKETHFRKSLCNTIIEDILRKNNIDLEQVLACTIDK